MSKSVALKTVLSTFLVVCVISLVGCDLAPIKEMYSSGDHASFRSSKSTFMGDTYKHKAKFFDGTKSIRELNTSEKNKIDVNLSIKSGTFQLVLVTDEKEEILLESDHDGSLDLSGYESRDYTLKMKGEEANFDLTIDFSK